jgi:hypothetical protein
MPGYRRLRDMRYYSDDPLVMRTLGVRRLPDVAALSRGLARADAEGAQRLQELVREGVVTRLVVLEFSRVTLDFDGSAPCVRIDVASLEEILCEPKGAKVGL